MNFVDQSQRANPIRRNDKYDFYWRPHFIVAAASV